MQEPRDLQPAPLNVLADPEAPVLARSRETGEGRVMSAEDAAKLESDKAILDGLPFGSFVEASGQHYVISAYKGRRWLYRVPKLASFKKRQKIASRARKAAREQGLLK